MEPRYLTEARGALADAEAILSTAKAFCAANKPNLSMLAGTDPASHATLFRRIEEQERLVTTLTEATVPARRKDVADAEERFEREVLDRDSADYEAEARKVEKKEIPAFYNEAKALAARLGLIDAHVERGKRLDARRAKFGLARIPNGEERARSTPGRVEPAVYEDRVVWRKHDGGSEVTVFKRSKSGELVPAEGGAVRSVERVCVRQERHIAPQSPKPLVEAVVIPGLTAGADPLWPKGRG